MRLIDTETGDLKEFHGRNIPSYAILSHTWVEGEEITYQEYISGSAKRKSGSQKILKTCEIAKRNGIPYAWVDTCCIDKSSSAELSEAINSMYRWYERSTVCYAFIQDLRPTDKLTSVLGSCRWFTRGWTLQELIAPKTVIFFDSAYNPRGTKRDLADRLSQITRINAELLRHKRTLSSFSVAQKLSWASSRETTRIEDEAYCLIGLFDLNMSLLYGEEERAFRRLQHEIIWTTADWSIFAWTASASDFPDFHEVTLAKDQVLCGLLAASPKEFSDCNNFVNHRGDLREFSLSNAGIKSKLRLEVHKAGELDLSNHHLVLPLNCKCGGYSLGISVRQIGRDKYLRQNAYKIQIFAANYGTLGSLTDKYFLTQLPPGPLLQNPRFEYMSDVLSRVRSSVVQFATDPDMFGVVFWPSDQWDALDNTFLCGGNMDQDFFMAKIFFRPEFFDKNHLPHQTAPVARICALLSLDDRPERAQFSIFEDKSFGSILDEVRGSGSGEDVLADDVLHWMRHYNVPRANFLRFEPLGQGLVAGLSLKTEVRRDEKIATGNVWRVHVSCTMYDREDVPWGQHELWNF